MKTAAYTICYNEIKRIDRWLEYTKDFDYRVVLDTGSNDGTYEVLKKVPNIILQQMRKEPFKFHHHRNYNLAMIPQDVDWCLSPDIDEWFSINVLEEIEKTVKEHPIVTNISTTRLDIYTKEVFVGPPHSLPSNKIHRRHLYEWRAPIYEYLSYIGPNDEVEVYNDKIFLIHDQDTSKPRKKNYATMLITQCEEDPTDNWNNWYLLNHYYREQELEKYIEVAVNFCRFAAKKDDKYNEVYQDLMNICKYENRLDTYIRQAIIKEIETY
jgi:hypothetical protein